MKTVPGRCLTARAFVLRIEPLRVSPVPASIAIAGDMKMIGTVTWHCSDEDSGPDVGKAISMPDGSELFFGDISKRLWENAGGCALGADDTGSWIVHWRKDGPQLIGRAMPDEGQIEMLAASLRAADIKDS